MTIEFQVCPYHEPHPAGFERTLVVDTFTRRFKCAACNAQGELLVNGELPPVESAQVYEDKEMRLEAKEGRMLSYEELDAFWKAHDKEHSDAQA